MQFGDKLISNSTNLRIWMASEKPWLYPLDYYLWGHLKGKVYTPKPANHNALRNNIIREENALDPLMVSLACWD